MSLKRAWDAYVEFGADKAESVLRSEIRQLTDPEMTNTICEWLVHGPTVAGFDRLFEALCDDSLLDVYCRIHKDREEVVGKLARLSHEYLPVRVLRRTWQGFVSIPFAGNGEPVLPRPHWPESLADMERRINRERLTRGIEAMVESGEWDRRQQEREDATREEG